MPGIYQMGWTVLSMLQFQTFSKTKFQEVQGEAKNGKGDGMISQDTLFAVMVDELVDYSKNDPELESGLKWLDELARERNITFYDMVFEVLYKGEDINKSTKYLLSRN